MIREVLCVNIIDHFSSTRVDYLLFTLDLRINIIDKDSRNCYSADADFIFVLFYLVGATKVMGCLKNIYVNTVVRFTEFLSVLAFIYY